MGLESDLLSVLPRCLLLLLRFLPVIAADVGAEATQFRVLCLQLHLLEVAKLVRAVLRCVRGTSHTVSCRVLASDLVLGHCWLQAHRRLLVQGRIDGDIRYVLDLVGQVRQVFVQEIVIIHGFMAGLSCIVSDLRLKVELHLLELLHLLSELVKARDVATYGHDLRLLLKQHHLL